MGVYGALTAMEITMEIHQNTKIKSIIGPISSGYIPEDSKKPQLFVHFLFIVALLTIGKL